MRIIFEVPGPQVSTNQAYRTGKGKFWITREGKEFKERISVFARKAMGIHPPLSLRNVGVSIEYFFRSKASDVDGPTKLVLDALQAGWGNVIESDKFVIACSARKRIDRDKPRTIIEVYTVDHPNGGK